MIRSLLLLALVPVVAFGQTEAPPAAAEATPAAAPAEAPVAEAPVAEAPSVEAAPVAVEPKGCARWKADGLGEGPVALGYVEADVATGRRACPRTEVGIGARFAAIIDSAAFYGNTGLDALIYGSVALGEKTEIFGTLEAVHFEYGQNASLKNAAGLPGVPVFGTLTLGATRQFYGNDKFLGALCGRLLLPTSFAIPNVRLIGAEIGHAATWRVKDWLEAHTYLGLDFSAGLGLGPAIPRIGGVLTIGAQLSPTSFAALVVDLTARYGARSYFAPTAALRFRVFRLGVELAATLPLIGDDRHDFIVGGRFNWRI